MQGFNSNGAARDSDGDIQLLDVLVVLLKRRRLVACIVLAFLAWGLGGYLVGLVPEKVKRAKIVETTAMFRVNPVLSFINKTSLDEVALSILKDPSFVIEEFKKSGLPELYGTKFNNITRDELSKYLQDKLFGSHISGQQGARSGYSVQNENGNLKFSILLDETLDYNRLYTQLLEGLNAKMRDWIEPSITIDIDTFTKYASFSYPREVVEQDLFSRYAKYYNSQKFIDGDENIFLLVHVPTIIYTENQQGTTSVSKGIKDMAFKAIAGLIVSVIAAFVMEWIEGVKTSEGSMQKVRQALARRK